MSSDDFSTNPFTALFASVSDVEKYKTSENEMTSILSSSTEGDGEFVDKLEINNYLQTILQVTIGR